MAIKDFLDRLKTRRLERSALLKQALEQRRIEKMVEDREKSANERELERFIMEEREARIKKELEFMRKKKDYDIKFGHNPLNIPNITNKTDWEVLKERNLFSNPGDFITSQKNIFMHNPNILSPKRRHNRMRFF